MTLQSIPGWCDYDDFYAFLVKEIPTGGTFVELGVWFGRSLCSFIQETIKEQKAINIIGVDNFHNYQEEPQLYQIVQRHTQNGQVFAGLWQNLVALGLSQRVRIIISDSIAAARCFPTASVDAVFIDTNHSYEGVTNDLTAWHPVVKEGGIISGHDFQQAQVAAAVYDFFNAQATKSVVQQWNNVFWLRKS